MAAALLPLDQRTIPVANKNGVRKEAPAIHKMWSTVRVWSPYLPPGDPQEMSVSGAADTWLSLASRVEADLAWLLRLPANKFWSQVCNDARLHQWLECLLETFPRPHDINVEHPDIKAKQQLLLHRLFLVFVRLCTHKESATDFFTPEYFGTMIYDQFLIEIPKILDICVVFRPCNPAITSRMIANVFKCQPQYMEDLVTAAQTMAAALDAVTEQFQVMQMSPLGSATVTVLNDLVNYVGDISATLAALMETHQKSGLALHQAGLDLRLAAFYSSLVMPLLKYSARYRDTDWISTTQLDLLVRRLGLSRHKLVTVFRLILDTVCLAALLGGEEVHGEPLEELLTVLASILSERAFAIDYNNRFPIRSDFEVIEGLGFDIDSTRKHYILDAFAVTVTKSFSDYETLDCRGETEKSSENLVTKDKTENTSSTSTVSNGGPSGVELESMISAVRDMLPHLGEGFVERCLGSYNYQVSELINALLEDNLPPHLAELDQTMKKEEQSLTKVTKVQPVPRSVYEEDEFDVNTQDKIDLSRVHRGKKNKVKDVKNLLDDKSELQGMKDKFDKLGIVSDEVSYEPGDEHLDDGYDDEYDDTYDDHVVGQLEPDALEESGRVFVLPVALGGGKIRPERNEKDEESDEEDEQDSKPNLNFARNPEEIRAENDRKRQERMAQRGGRRGGRGGGGGGAPDVVGRAKGQGQEKSVLIARARKNANKGKGHRIGADKKAAKGMF